MARRHELTDHRWAPIADLSPAQGRDGRWADHRTAIYGMTWRRRNGAPWRDLPERYGDWRTVDHRFDALRGDGLLDRILERLRARLNAEGLIDAELLCVDGTVTRATRASKESWPPASRRATP